MSVKKYVHLAVLTALSIVIGIFEFPYFPAPFLKFDLSEVVILAAATYYSPLSAILISILRSVIRYLLTGGTNIPFPFFGEGIAIIASSYLVLISQVLTSKLKKTSYVFIIILVIILQVTFLTLFNYLIVTPAFMSKGKYAFLTNSFLNEYPFLKGERGYLKLVLTTYIPFNLIKYVVNFFVATPIMLLMLARKQYKLVYKQQGYILLR